MTDTATIVVADQVINVSLAERRIEAEAPR
jgi:hypothetical protein